MATVKQVYELLEKMANGDGLVGIKNNLELLNDKFETISKDVEEIKQEGFHGQESLRTKLTLLKKSVDNIKTYEIAELKRKFETNSQNKNKIYLQVVGGFILLVVGYVFSTLIG